MSAIITELFSDKRFDLNASSIARPIALGSWNTLRIGMLIQTTSTASISSGFQFGVGLCSGTTNVLGDATTTHFVGINSGTAAWPFASSWLRTGTFFGYKRVGTTPTTTANLSITTVCRGEASISSIMTFFAVEMIFGSPNFTIRMFARNALTAATVTEVQFLNAMETSLNNISLANHIYQGAAQLLAVNEGADGTLDAVNVFWSPSTSNMQIASLAVSILS